MRRPPSEALATELPRKESVVLSADSAYLIATLTTPPSAEELDRLNDQADALEVRADLMREVEPEKLRERFRGELIYTLRSRAEGGQGTSREAGRWEQISAAAERYDRIDLEADRDLTPDLLSLVPRGKRITSWHGRATELVELRQRLAAMEAVGASLYKLIPEARKTGEGLLPLAFLKSVSRTDVVAFASGPAGGWSRLLAPRLGAPVVYGSAGPEAAAPGQLSIDRLRADYGLPALPSVEFLFGIAGNPVRHSLSPRIYNGMFQERDMPCAYLPFHVDTFGDFWLDVVESGSLDVLGFKLCGLSVTAPFKEIALAVAGAASPLAERIGSANSLTNRGGVWEAESTDPEGLLGPLRGRGVDLVDLRVAVVGAGGAGRAAAFGLARGGARVTLINRSRERGKRVATELDVGFEALGDFDPGAFSLVVNATPLGRGDKGDLPFDPTRLSSEAIVVDLAYVPSAPTRLVREVRAAGATAIDGREVLLAQAIQQSLIMTGEQLSAKRARELMKAEISH
jgi:3-dehydroquinate dehydratase/shikimate dehydrogenase